MTEPRFQITDISAGPCTFIYNDLSRTHPTGSPGFLEILSDAGRCQIPFCVDGTVIHLGLWLRELPVDVLRKSCRFLFGHYPRTETIQFVNCLTAPGPKERCTVLRRNHWMIEFPDTFEELSSRLSSKKRYNIRRQKRLAMELPGGYRIAEYTADTVPPEVIETYFALKRNQFGTDYHTSPTGYLSQYHVSHVYALQLSDGIGAIVMTCEQYPYVYLENLAYDPKYSSYSLGATLYDHVLQILISKGKRGLYLGYGKHQYKSLYGAIEQMVYCATIYRSSIRYFLEVRCPGYRKAIRSFLGKALRRLRARRKE